MDPEGAVRNLEHRVSQIEQILPTLATKDDMHLALEQQGNMLRRHMDVLAESLRSDIRLLAEGLGPSASGPSAASRRSGKTSESSTAA